MSNLFYRAFEEKFRGSRSLIRSRLGIYRSFLSPLKSIYPDAQGLDLGCGRGEWLEVLQEERISPLGVDMDEGMLEACRALNLPSQQGDAIAYLSALPAESQAVVSAFHMVEHISFEQLQVVVSESLRVLKPGGLLIMETPNPENIGVATRDFYLDPTHQRPIPPQLLSFLPQHCGYHRTKILRLQQSADIEQNTDPNLIDVIEGASPDYAVIAQKTAVYSHLAAFDAAFSEEYGLPLHVLAARYDTAGRARTQQTTSESQKAKDKAQQAEARSQQAEATAQHAETTALRAETTALQAEIKAQQAETAAQQAEALTRSFEAIVRQAETAARHAEAIAQQAEMSRQQACSHLHAVLSSTSWRATAPARWVGIQLKLLKQHGFINRIKALAKRFAHPFATPDSRIANAPASNEIRIETKNQLIDSHAQDNQPAEVSAETMKHVAQKNLSARARQIYAELNTAIRKGNRIN